ncbi:endonuclease III domain-containing protein [Pontibacter akesuensis]|uniref:Endonuclease-3 n=1 Tax=Pontibacter akesuensis TaxID=388950 RepID=A0A1I7K9G0_9BACT|nr:endonuclease III [Pontibacter akesuensis]GHA74041.1 endonuclease III [Pontibacter akesuensis]SFU94015.1 endonuclease-3 [Pontibacter akesuensis]
MDAHQLPAAEKTQQTHELLNQAYKRLTLDSRRTPMHELVSTMLSHRTNHADEVKAYNTMLERFGDWEGVMQADENELADAIQTTRYPGQKAPQIQQTLRRIQEKQGEINIDFLKDIPVEEAMEWLTSLPGVGLKTATLLLLFNFKKPVLPVDTHVFRVSQRVGLIGASVTANKAHALLLSMLPKDPVELFNFHKHLFWHGQRVCTFYSPKCEECVLQHICNYYQGVRLKKIDT